jgi:hypothetical protein
MKIILLLLVLLLNLNQGRAASSLDPEPIALYIGGGGGALIMLVALVVCLASCCVDCLGNERLDPDYRAALRHARQRARMSVASSTDTLRPLGGRYTYATDSPTDPGATLHLAFVTQLDTPGWSMKGRNGTNATLVEGHLYGTTGQAYWVDVRDGAYILSQGIFQFGASSSSSSHENEDEENSSVSRRRTAIFTGTWRSSDGRQGDYTQFVLQQVSTLVPTEARPEKEEED